MENICGHSGPSGVKCDSSKGHSGHHSFIEHVGSDVENGIPVDNFTVYRWKDNGDIICHPDPNVKRSEA